MSAGLCWYDDHVDVYRQHVETKFRADGHDLIAEIADARVATGERFPDSPLHASGTLRPSVRSGARNLTTERTRPLVELLERPYLEEPLLGGVKERNLGIQRGRRIGAATSQI